jgi:hypothetical protein
VGGGQKVKETRAAAGCGGVGTGKKQKLQMKTEKRKF